MKPLRIGLLSIHFKEVSLYNVSAQVNLVLLARGLDVARVGDYEDE